MSIRKRLLAWLLPGLLLAVSLAGFAIYRETLEGVSRVQDYALRQIAYSMEYSNRGAPRFPEEGEEPDNEQDEIIPDNDNFEYAGEIWNHAGRLTLASNPEWILPKFGLNGFGTIPWHGRKWRVFGTSVKGEYIQVAQPQISRSRAAAGIAGQALVPILILIPALGLLTWFGISYGLKPLKRIASDLDQRGADSLQPIPVKSLPEEVGLLAAALNALLERLSDSFKLQKNFIADAAHELRTPLTALMLQTEIMSRSRDEAEAAEAFRKLQQGIQRSSRLVAQLLTMARLEEEGNFESVDLDALSREVIGDLEPLAQAKCIDLGLESGGAAFVHGNREALRTMLANLVDNAIRYIQEEGSIDVRIGRDEMSTILEVEDDGPGIPEEERERVFDRFYRGLGSNAIGSGLGLSIVKGIAESHDALVSLPKGSKGLLVRVEFPEGS